jgi:hypothetical protein
MRSEDTAMASGNITSKADAAESPECDAALAEKVDGRE